MNQIQNKYVILGSLCALLLTLVVGYAAFSTVLKIKGTSNINSNWDIQITNIEKIESKGSIDVEGTPKYESLTATFNTNFTTPGDYATYKIEITNNGSLDAILKNITMPENTNNDIIFYLNKNQNNEEIKDSLKQNDTLFKSGETGNIGYVYVTVLYRDYENQQTPTKDEDKTASMTITFDFEQADGSGGTAGGQTAADKLIETSVTTGDGLYADEYEEGRYVYKGANPNNYITFNNELWRIISIEKDGTLKIMKKDSIGDRAFDSQGHRDSTSNGAGGTYCAQGSSGCNAWSISDNFTNGTKSGTVLKDAGINIYLNNDYYNTLSSEAQNLIQNHTWGIGPVTPSNTDLAAQIASEKSTTWNGNIGLMSVSDYIRANTNMEQCGNFSLNYSNYKTCKTTNYIISSVPTSGYLWTISPDAFYTIYVFFVRSNGLVFFSIADSSTNSVLPALYLTSNIHLEGEGTESNPYTIKKA